MNKNAELEYLMNPVLYDKYKQLSYKEDEACFKRDRQFYRKRIGQMAKHALRSKEEEQVPTQIQKCYDDFAKQCIQHFKCQDESECFQEGLGHINEILTNDTDTEETNNNVELLDSTLLDKNLLGQREKKKVITMDSFVRKTITNPVAPPIIPKQHEVNSKNEKYRTKGLKKKKSK